MISDRDTALAVLQNALAHRYVADDTCPSCQIILRAVDALRPLLDRLKAAEDVCVMYAWSPSRAGDGTDREKAAHELWVRWLNLPGTSALPEDHPDLTDDQVAELARQRDATRERTLRTIADRYPELASRWHR